MSATVLQAVAKAVSGGGATTVGIVPGSATSATGLLLAFGTCRAAFAATPVTDTGGRTWSPVSAVIFTGTSGLNYGLWTAPTGAGGDTPTVTIHGASSNWIEGCLVECATCDTSTTPISVSATHSQTTSGTTLTLGPTATCGANEVAVSFVGCDGASTFTAPVGWATVTQQGSLVVGVSNLSVNNQPITAVWTVSANDNVGGIVVSVKAAGGSGVTVNLAGQTGTFSEGTPTPAIAYGLTGQTATFAEGAITRAVASALTGQTATFSLGTITPAISYGLAGQTATFAEGVITASTGGNVTLSLGGQTATFSQGALSAAIAYPVMGQSITSSEGAIASSLTYGLSAQTGTFSEGVITAQVMGDVTIQLGGLTAIFALGTISISGQDMPVVTVPSQGGSGFVRGRRKVVRPEDRAPEEGYAVSPFATSIPSKLREAVPRNTASPKGAKAQKSAAALDYSVQRVVIEAMLKELL